MNQINDPLKKARDVKDIGHYSSGETEIKLKIEMKFHIH